MLTLFAYFPGQIIFQAMKDGEPLAFVLVGAVVAVIVIGLAFKGKSTSTVQQS